MGKSTTAQMFAEAGVPVHDADAAVHRLYSGEAVPLIEAAFPGSISHGKVDRDRLAAQVVGKPKRSSGSRPSSIRWWDRRATVFWLTPKRPARSSRFSISVAV